MPTEDIETFALVQYKALVAAHDHFFELRSQMIMEFKDCQDMAERVRTALKTFTEDAVGTVVEYQTSVTPDFQPLYDILNDAHTTLLAAQDKLNSVKPSASTTPTSMPIASSTFVGGTRLNPIVVDGPVLPSA